MFAYKVQDSCGYIYGPYLCKKYGLHRMRSEKNIIEVNSCKIWCEWQLTSFKAS